ncbi:MAG: glycosyltransferase family 2 protein [Oscillospiraceae bacterium]|nr:glycosyltransferase family 2 protein [Oscillospiraceae bacterium]
MNNTLYIVIPCYNEEDALPLTSGVILEKLKTLTARGKISAESRILLVDDGSRDGTWSIIKSLTERHPEYCGVKLSGNRGTQSAIMAGLDAARRRADFTITTDADLQDDINAIDEMTEQYLSGADVVYGVRSKRETDTFFKRFTALTYYRLLNMLDCGVVYNHSDFRLLSRRAMEALSEYPERDLFIRGIVPRLGFKSAVVTYERGERSAGETKYTARSLIHLAVTGVTSLSLKPLRMIIWLGAVMLLVSVATFVSALASGAGALRFILPSVWFVGGVVTAAIGVVGEYVGRTYTEAKRRPRYHIEAVAGKAFEDGDNKAPREAEG